MQPNESTQVQVLPRSQVLPINPNQICPTGSLLKVTPDSQGTITTPRSVHFNYFVYTHEPWLCWCCLRVSETETETETETVMVQKKVKQVQKETIQKKHFGAARCCAGALPCTDASFYFALKWTLHLGDLGHKQLRLRSKHT